jgi:hypothetical protein
MNRRDALKSLLATPAIASVAVAQVHPGDVIVVQAREGAQLSLEDVRRIEHFVNGIFPSNKVMVVDGSLSLSIKRPSDV